MINIKKVFSLVLVTVLIVTSFVSFAADEEDYTDPEILGDSAKITTDVATESNENEQTNEPVSEEKVEKQIFSPLYSGIDRVNIYSPDNTQMLFNILKTLGIMESYESLDAILTRGEFAGFVARIMQGGKSENNSSYRYEFKDVDETVANQSDIIYLANYGIVQGDGQGNFYPDNYIKSAEALVMLLNSMGYYEIAQMYGEGLTGYLMLANKLELSKEIDINTNSELTVESAIKLIYHALHERVADINSFKNDSFTFKTSDETLMYRYMNVMTVEGVVTANEYTSLNSPSGSVATKCLKIGNTSVSFSQSNIIPADYLGLYTRVYFKENSGDYQAFFAECIENRQEILKLNAEDIIGYNELTKTLSYVENDRIKTESIPINASIIFNKVAVTGGIDARCFTPDAGQVVFIDNNGDSNYDCIMIDLYTTYLVKNSLSSESDILYDELSIQPMIPFNLKEVRVMKNNAEATAKDVLSGNVAMVASNKVTYETIGSITYPKIDSSSEFYTVLVSDYQIKGNLESITENNEVVIDGVEYEYSNGFLVSAEKGGSNKTIESMAMNVAVTAGLDLDGNIVWLVRGTDSSLKYGYLVKMGSGTGFQTDWIKIFTQDNEMLTFNFANRIKVFAQWEAGSIDDSTYYSKSIDGDAVTDLNLLYSGGVSIQQLLQYKLDADGNISAVYIAASDSRSYTKDVPILYNNIFYKSCTLTDTAYHTYDIGGVISPLFEYNKTHTFGFAVPDNPNITDAKYFSAHKNEITLFGNGTEIEKIDLYNVDNGRIGAFVYKQKVNVTDGYASVVFDNNSTFKNIIIESARLVLDDEGEVTTEIMAYYQNKLVKLECTSGSLVSLENSNDTDLNEVKISELKRGDIVLIHQNTLNQIDGFKVLHRVHKAMKDAGNSLIPGYEQIWDGALYQSESPVYPSLFARGEVVKTIDGIPYVNTGRSDGLLRRMLVYGSANQIIIYDVQNDEMILTQDRNERGDFSQLQEGDYLFWYLRDRSVLSAVAIRNYK